MTVMLENNALIRTAPWPFSIPNSGMISGSIGGKSRSGIPKKVEFCVMKIINSLSLSLFMHILYSQFRLSVKRYNGASIQSAF